MAVVVLYMSDRDSEKRTFTSKADADALDKKLELAENLQIFLEKHIPEVEESLSERIALLFAEHKDALASALKGKPDELLAAPREIDQQEEPA
ncbi:MAG: YebG family protein [Hahellaceae bacterium]|nr:YebG family protein [Hahellaceae bacterium]